MKLQKTETLSPDLTFLDFCLWSWMKNEVYANKVETREALLACILNACAYITECRNQLRPATQYVLIRSAKCIEVDGGIFKNIYCD